MGARAQTDGIQDAYKDESDTNTFQPIIPITMFAFTAFVVGILGAFTYQAHVGEGTQWMWRFWFGMWAVRVFMRWTGTGILAWISWIFGFVYLMWIVIGLPVTIFKLDKEATTHTSQRAYALIFANACVGMFGTMCTIATMSFGLKMINSLAMSILTVIHARAFQHL